MSEFLEACAIVKERETKLQMALIFSLLIKKRIHTLQHYCKMA